MKIKNIALICNVFLLSCFFNFKALAVEYVVSDVLRIDPELKFEWNKKHLPHANPDAPKQGSLILSARGSFDSLHSFIPRGMPAAGLGLTYDTLGESVPDNNIFETHGLIAEKFSVALDNSEIIFHINPKARFHDNSPITAEDVVFSFNILMSKGAPSYKQYYKSVDKVEALSTYDVRFTFKEKDNKELPLILAQLPVISKKYWENKDFSKPSLEPSLGNGAYKIKEFSPGSYIVLERVKDYWAKDFPMNKGRYNFDTIRYEYYRDETIAREAFKAGAFDFYSEGTAKAWATSYVGKAFDGGYIVKEEVPIKRSQGMYGFFFNTRQKVFSDKKVRQAISLLFDFEWTNKTLFYNNYKRSDSYFTNSEFVASGLPSADELALLKPFADQLPKEVFSKEFIIPKTKGDGQIHEQMKQAFALFQEAGLKIQDGKMLNPQGEQLKFTILLSSSSLQRILLPFKSNLERFGIIMEISVLESTLYLNRVRSFEYDMIISRIPQSSHPGNEQNNYWSTKSASTNGSRNYSGVSSPVVDALIEKIIGAKNRKELVTACKALDRVLLWDYYVIPGWYSANSRIAYWNKFKHTDITPANGLDIFSWWIDQEAEKVLENSDTGYGNN